LRAAIAPPRGHDHLAGEKHRRSTMRPSGKTGSRYALLFAGAAGVALLAMPSLLAAYPLIIFSQMLVFAIACLALNLAYGATGMLSLGHATYFGVAAYAGAFLYRFSAVNSFELYMLSGIISSTVFAAVTGFVCVRTTKIFFAILTLAVSMIVYSLVIDGAVFRLFGEVGWSLYLFGGGALYIPRLTILGRQFAPADFIPAFYNVIVAAFLACGLALWRINRSPFGQALRAIRDNDVRAAFIGIPVWQYRWRAFTISGFFMGVAGSLYGQLARQITPDQLHWLYSAQLVLATVLGGSRHFLGPILGAFAFVGIDEIASQWAVGRYAAFGLLLIIVVFAFPRGVAGALVDLASAMKGAGWKRRPWIIGDQ
jgi:branched-chain amino acid transport system permease protein